MKQESENPCTGSNCYVPHERLERFERTLNEVKTALVGDERLGNRGIVPRLAHVEAQLQQIMTERAAESNARRGAMWVVGTVAGIIGAIGAIIGSIVKAIFSNHG
jgi:hypothetical protein